MPKISVVIPTYNRANLLPTAVTSVLEQTYRDLEILVIDDGSTDNTWEILQAFSGKVRPVHQQNTGGGAARNRGIREASGDFIAFLDSDDLWLQEKLEVQMELVARSPGLTWAYSDAYAFSGESGEILFVFSQRSRQYSGDIGGRLLFSDFIPSPTPVVHRSVFEDVGGFSDMKVGEDWEMWLRIAAKYPVGRSSEVLAGYRVHADAVSSQIGVESLLHSRLEVIQRAIAASPDAYSPLGVPAAARQYVSAARDFLRRGDTRRAKLMCRRAIRLSPKSVTPYATLLSTALGSEGYRRLIAIYDRFRDRKG
jgi:glycosyltransferase involved in cell wall biosynthesis